MPMQYRVHERADMTAPHRIAPFDTTWEAEKPLHVIARLIGVGDRVTTGNGWVRTVAQEGPYRRHTYVIKLIRPQPRFCSCQPGRECDCS